MISLALHTQSYIEHLWSLRRTCPFHSSFPSCCRSLCSLKVNFSWEFDVSVTKVGRHPVRSWSRSLQKSSLTQSAPHSTSKWSYQWVFMIRIEVRALPRNPASRKVRLRSGECLFIAIRLREPNGARWIKHSGSAIPKGTNKVLALCLSVHLWRVSSCSWTLFRSVSEFIHIGSFRSQAVSLLFQVSQLPDHFVGPGSRHCFIWNVFCLDFHYFSRATKSPHFGSRRCSEFGRVGVGSRHIFASASSEVGPSPKS